MVILTPRLLSPPSFWLGLVAGREGTGGMETATPLADPRLGSRLLCVRFQWCSVKPTEDPLGSLCVTSLKTETLSQAAWVEYLGFLIYLTGA